MKKIFTFFIFALSISIYSQIKGVTDEGKDVVLFDNGTWKFVNESDKETLETITTNPTIFVKNDSATFLLRSKVLDVGVFYNAKKWKIAKRSPNRITEYILTDTKFPDEGFALMMTEKVKIPTLKNLKEIIISGIQRNVDFFRLKESEYRTVNGLKVLCLHYIANTKGIDFEYLGYYQISDEGYCGVATFALMKDFDKFQPQFEEFLNGFSAVKKDEIKEEIIYSNPPPPMKPK